MTINTNFFGNNNIVGIGTNSKSNFGIIEKDYELNNGEKYFTLNKLEVFQVFLY